METKTGQPGGKNENNIDRIMLKFRPIAPKPVPPGADATDLVPYKRTKRKYVKIKKTSKCNIVEERGRRDVLFDVAIDALQSPAGESRKQGDSVRNPITEVGPRRIVESWLVVDGLTETFPGHGMDIEEEETCPVLISDGEQRVGCMNLAYKKLVGDDEEGSPAVWIVMKEKIPETWTVFTCRGTVVYRWGEEKHSQQITMPCDVWRRMELGGFIWRLDAKAALRLGPSLQ